MQLISNDRCIAENPPGRQLPVGCQPPHFRDERLHLVLDPLGQTGGENRQTPAPDETYIQT